MNPQEIRGSNTGVYVGVSVSELEQYINSDESKINGHGLTGCSRSMFANRISSVYDLKGPSFASDTACSSSIMSFSQAFADFKTGYIDAAIVAGTNLTLLPTISLHFKRLGMLSVNGTCRSFDADGAGYVRAEGCVVFYIQRATKARRVYASVLNARINTDGHKEQGITFPSGEMQNRLITETYNSVGIRGADVTYVEAHGTGTAAGDPQEVNSITDFFCVDRKEPLLVGSVKSNMGHSEAASGTCSLAKILIAMENGIIPGNLHYNTPNPELKSIIDGRIKVVDRNTQWNGGIVGLNSFGFGGANGHVILKSFTKPKALPIPENSLPRLVITSGRTNESVLEILGAAQVHKNDSEFLGLINDIHLKNIPRHGFRGYTIVDGSNTVSLQESQEMIDQNRPIWYIYSGMGSQWAGMARDLMQIDVFRNSIEKCAKALRSEGIDLIKVMTEKDDNIFNSILNSFISITAIQVALTDLLHFLNITPNGVVGHSVGELGCAYADGCFTPEQAVLAAYWRGKSILDTDLAPGAMAAVGLSWEQCKKRLPEDIIPACHNSADSVTVCFGWKHNLT